MSLRALWFRPLVARPLRAAATALGVALGVASIVSTVLASRAAVASLGADVETIAGAAALEIRRPGGVTLDELAELRPLCAHALVVPVVEGVVHVPALGDLARVLGVDLLVDADVRALELDAPDVDAARDAMLLGRGAAVSAALADELGAAPGDAIEALVDARLVELELVALFEPERFASAWDRVILVDVAFAQELFGRTTLDRVELRPRGEGEAAIDVATLRERALAALPAGALVGPASVRRAEGERMVAALRFNLTALSGVSLLVGVVLVATTLATSVVQRRHVLALLRSLGASRAQLAAAVLGEAAVLGLAGGALGVVLGELAARGALAGVRASVTTVAPSALAGAVEGGTSLALAGLVVGLVAALVAAVLPLREALDVPPIQGLRRVRDDVRPARPRARWTLLAALLAGAALCARMPPWEDRPVWALVSALLLLASLLVLAGPLVDLAARARVRLGRSRWSVPLVLAQAALAAGRRRAAWAAGAVGVAVALAVSMVTMVGSFRRTVVDWTDATMRSDLFVRPMPAASGASAGGLDPAVASLARELFGAGAVDAYHASEARVRGARVELAGGDFAVRAREGGAPFLAGGESREVFARALASGGVVVNEPFARRFHVEAGDVVTFDTAGGAIERRVEGVYRDYSAHRGRAVLDRADLLALDPHARLESLAVFLPQSASDGSVRAARARLSEALAGRFALDVLLNREVRREVLDVFERTFAVTVALQLLAVVVACIAVVTVLGALVQERRGDVAVVRALGGSAAQVAGIVLAQALLLGAAGALGGLAVGLAVGWVLVAVVNVQSFGWTLAFQPPWSSILGTVGLVVPACLAAGLVPALAAARKSIQEDLREND